MVLLLLPCRYQSGKYYASKRLFGEFSILINTDEQYTFNVSDARSLDVDVAMHSYTAKTITAFHNLHVSFRSLCEFLYFEIHFVLISVEWNFLLHTFFATSSFNWFNRFNGTVNAIFMCKTNWKWKPFLITLISFIIRWMWHRHAKSFDLSKSGADILVVFAQNHVTCSFVDLKITVRKLVVHQVETETWDKIVQFRHQFVFTFFVVVSCSV